MVSFTGYCFVRRTRQRTHELIANSCTCFSESIAYFWVLQETASETPAKIIVNQKTSFTRHIDLRVTANQIIFHTFGKIMWPPYNYGESETPFL